MLNQVFGCKVQFIENSVQRLCALLHDAISHGFTLQRRAVIGKPQDLVLEFPGLNPEAKAMRHPKVLAWEARLQELLDRIDHELEEQYGSAYPLHPSRPGHGKTSSRSSDGLFQIEASFSPGFGTGLGRGYILRARMVTLQQVPPEIQRKLEDETARRIRQYLPEYFPGLDLQVERDGRRYKIFGDLSLGDNQ